MTAEQINTYVGVLVALMIGTWGVVEALGLFVGWDKRRLACLVGIATGLIAHGAGILTDANRGWWDWLLAAFVGLGVAMGGQIVADKVVNPWRKQT